MALKEANRLRRGSVGSIKENDEIVSPANEGGSVTQIEASSTEESDGENAEDQILILSELEFSVSEDLKLEKENLEMAKDELSNSEFLLIEKELRDRVSDLQNLLIEIKSVKLDFLRNKISTLKEEPEENLKPFGFSFFNDSVQTSMDRELLQFHRVTDSVQEIIWKFNCLGRKTLGIPS